jgi:ribosome-binding factor A
MSRARSSARGAEPSQRLLRVGEAIRHALAEVLTREELRDPALSGVSVTVSEVKPSADLRSANVFVLPLGGRDKGEVLEGLARCAPFLRGQVAKRVRLKFTPELHFRLDDRFERAERIAKLLNDERVRADLEKKSEE